MGVNRIAMGIIVALCTGLAGLVLAAGQPLERTAGILLILLGVVLIGWFGLRTARRGQARPEAFLKTPPPTSFLGKSKLAGVAPGGVHKWRWGVSGLLLALGTVVMLTRPRAFSGYIFTAAGVAGLLGFNIFRGGPLDKRRPSA